MYSSLATFNVYVRHPVSYWSTVKHSKGQDKGITIRLWYWAWYAIESKGCAYEKCSMQAMLVHDVYLSQRFWGLNVSDH